MTYEEYIASPLWAAKRRARLALDGFRCRLCDEDGSTYPLQVHHRPSSYARIPNESVEDDLITICSRCHELITDAIRKERYGRRDLPAPELILAVTPIRKELDHGLANDPVQVDLFCASDPTQRADCGPDQQVGQIDQADYFQEQQDRYRP